MPLRKASIEVIDQLAEVIDDIKDIYTREDIGSCPGKHIRHILDHYSALKLGNESGVVNYDLRSRNSDEESSTEAAKLRLNAIRHWFVESEWLEGAIQVESEVSVSDTVNSAVVSTIEREVAYVHAHTIHHLAHIRLLAKVYQVSLGVEVGIAPATGSFLRSQS